MEDLLIFRLVCLCLAAVVSASAEGQRLSAVVGGEVTLPCDATGYVPLKVVEWSRPDNNLEYVLIFNNQTPDPDIPKQSYQGRVHLKNRENGDVSLVLKNVTVEDRGTYECYVLKKTNRQKRALQPISIIHLDVASPPPGDKDGNKEDGVKERGHIGLVVGVMFSALTVAVVILTAASVFVRRRKMNSSPPHPPHNEAEQPLQV
ncbi:hypothetical protein ILYODFUR_034684 [Ilyodon furcidens]|uniref:Ig-like domain-containing protein n=1 Tax=Ilyodon furcidens TaxID=33524 RepID=A0ABV0T6B3_9TELE